MFYIGFLALNALEMLWEVRISARNSATLIERGAMEIAPSLLPIMSFIYVAMYICSGWEYAHVQPHLSLRWGVSFLSLFAIAKLLKFWAVSSLGSSWTMKVLIVPGSKVVVSGPYKWMRHPNYIAVLLEIAATTLLGKCFATFAGVLSSFLIVLFFRIRAEETALLANTDYATQMIGKNRFLP